MPISVFTQECRDAAKALRRLPAEVKKDMRTEMRTAVAEPLARAIASDVSGPYAAAIRPTVLTKSDVEPVIKIGGKRKAVSGGASANNLLYGANFGGGKKVGRVTRKATNKRKGRRRRGAVAAGGTTTYRRRTTAQFPPPPGQDFIFGTIAAEGDRTFQRFSEAVERVLERHEPRGA